MSYTECTEKLVEDALRVFENEDLVSLSSLPEPFLLEDAKSIMGNMMVFRRKCYSSLSRDEYNYYWSVFNGALLKIAAAMREAGVSPDEPGARSVLRMFTDDEIEALREFEKYSKLDPEITPPERLAEVIVAGKGEIYELVKDAVRKQYIDFAGLIKTWSREKRIRDYVSRALQIRYEKRFHNIVEAVKRLIDTQPAWLLRLFTEYEEALLEARRLRGEIEERLHSIPSPKEIEEKIEHGAPPRMVKEEARRSIEVIEEARSRLEKKARELLEKKEAVEDEAAREALEAEAERLRTEAERLEEEKRVYGNAEVMVSLEELRRGGEASARGRLIDYGEARTLSLVFRERFTIHMNTLPLRLRVPLTGQEIRVDKWSRGDVSESGGDHGYTITYTVRKGLLRRNTVMVLEALYYLRRGVYEEKGYDDKPMGLGELVDMVEPRVLEARRQGYYHVMLVASPTGFTDRVISYVSGEEYHRLILSSSLALILVDPLTGEIYHHPADEAVAMLGPLLKPLLPFEEVEKVAAAVRDLEVDAIARSPSLPYYTLDELVEKTGARREIVRAALEKLEKEGAGKVRTMDNRIVFVYAVEA